MKLCIDAGHGYANRRPGLYDPGATVGNFSEADVVLDVALTGRWIAKTEFGIETWLTRDDDRDPTPVGSRDDRAEQAGCTHLLSLHCNAANGVASGTETYYRDGADKSFAQKVQAAAITAWDLKSRGLKTEHDSQHNRLAVFDFDGPAALLEIGFIDSETDRLRMLSRDRRIEFWRSLLTTLKGWAEL
jgi:N-acetylmuramoyl-L-alanine amidase